MRLNLGCGRRRLDGYINVDLHDSDLDCDIRLLPEYFKADSAEEIMAIHVCEHFYIHEIAAILTGWREVLKEGGTIILELPCWDKVKRHIVANGPDNMTRWPLFGDPATHRNGEPALHKWCYSTAEFGKLLMHVGFRGIKQEVPKFHVPDRDMRWVATK